jgi:hypothetical protein
MLEMKTETLVKFNKLYGRISIDIDVMKLIRKKEPPLIVEVPVLEFADKNCLFELGGFNRVTNKGVSVTIFNEDLELYDGIKFFKKNWRKNNGKQAILPVTIGTHIVFGSVFQRQRLDIRCDIAIYKIEKFKRKESEIEDEKVSHKVCICELVHRHSSSIFSIKDTSDEKFEDVLKMSLKKTMTKDCKKSLANAWINGKFNTNEYMLIEGLESIVELNPKTFCQISNAKDMVEDYFISNDQASIRSCMMVFEVKKKDIIIKYHIFESFDIKRIKQEKKTIQPKIYKSFRVNIPNDYVFSQEICWFFLCPERTASSLYNFIVDGEKNNLSYIDGIETPFVIRLFKG